MNFSTILLGYQVSNFHNPKITTHYLHYSSKPTTTLHHTHYFFLSPGITFFLTLINKGCQHPLPPRFMNSLPKLYPNLYSWSTHLNTINQHSNVYHLTFKFISFIHWSHHQSDLSVRGIFWEITPWARLTCCVAELQVASAEELHHNSSSLAVDLDNASTSGISSVSRISSFHYRNSLAPFVGK